ncbi:MAG: type II secretion system ATPase GspE [Elusimicrobia bacterium]|nr:type II secretion system ATPase GspE [Elusimicrobiota bacterium]
MGNAQHALSIGLPKRLADLMVAQKLITAEQLKKALEVQRQGNEKLGGILVEKGFITEEALLEFMSKQCGISYVSLASMEIPEDVIALVPESIARQHTLIPCNKTKDRIIIALADPLNVLILDDLKMMTGCDTKAVLASEAEIHAALDKYYKPVSSQAALDEIVKQTSVSAEEAEGIQAVEETTEEEDSVSLEKSAEDAPVIKMVNLMMASAIKARASDIHIEPFQKDIRVRYRIDGVLHEQPAPPRKFHSAISTRIKIMANLNIAERRIPQDGRLKLKIESKEVDMRVSILPCATGEKIVMRILDSSGLRVQLSQLGLEPEALAVFAKCMNAPYGINLITGPTGSGKSTTLYSALANLNTPETNIMTCEDPVEYQLHGINQVQVNAQVGLTFAAGLRSFLRQDPDVIMVGEIRDLETAQIAINAALTGHLVFSTLHTNDAAGSITRLGMMGVEPFLVSSAFLMVVAQRLVRGVCPKCRESYEVEVDWLVKLGVPKNLLQPKAGKVTLTKGKGCENCAGTGYRGRQGLYEILEVTDPVRELIVNKASTKEIKTLAVKQGMLTLRNCAIRKLLSGNTTVEEMIRVTASDSEGG